MVEGKENLGAISGSRPSGQAPTGLDGSRFDPVRWQNRLLVRCMGGSHCDHAPGVCTADPEYQRYMAAKREAEKPPRQMHMVWHAEAGEVCFEYPSNLSAQDAADVRDLLLLALNGIDRRAIAMEAREGRDGETRLDPKDDSAGRQASPGGSNA